MSSTEYRILKIRIDNPCKLQECELCRATYRTFASRFTCYEDAAKHLDRHIRRNGKRPNVVGYIIRRQSLHGEVKFQWSFAPDGRFLACACMDCDVKFEGRDADILPFRKGDKVITHWGRDMMIGVISAEPPTPAEVKKLIAGSKYKENWLDSSDDCYLVNFTDNSHSHPSVSAVFPPPFPVSDISEKVKATLPHR